MQAAEYRERLRGGRAPSVARAPSAPRQPEPALACRLKQGGPQRLRLQAELRAAKPAAAGRNVLANANRGPPLLQWRGLRAPWPTDPGNAAAAPPGSDGHRRRARRRSWSASRSVARAPAEDLQEQLDAKQAKLDQAKEKKGVLTTEISALQRADRPADRRGRRAAQPGGGRPGRARPGRGRARRRAARPEDPARAPRPVGRGRSRTGSSTIYKSDEPDALTVVLEADGFDDAARALRVPAADPGSRTPTIVGRVRELRDEMAARRSSGSEATRDSIAAQEGRARADPRAARGTRGASSTRPASQQQAGARADRTITSTTSRATSATSRRRSRSSSPPRAASRPLPAGPIQGGSAGFIWPVNGPIVSGFGMRWGQLPRGRRHRRPRRDPDPRRQGRHDRLRPVRGRERRLRQLHLHRPRRRALHLLRPPVQLRDHLGLGPARAT